MFKKYSPELFQKVSQEIITFSTFFSESHNNIKKYGEIPMNNPCLIYGRISGKSLKEFLDGCLVESLEVHITEEISGEITRISRIKEFSLNSPLFF